MAYNFPTIPTTTFAKAIIAGAIPTSNAAFPIPTQARWQQILANGLAGFTSVGALGVVGVVAAPGATFSDASSATGTWTKSTSLALVGQAAGWIWDTWVAVPPLSPMVLGSQRWAFTARVRVDTTIASTRNYFGLTAAALAVVNASPDNSAVFMCDVVAGDTTFFVTLRNGAAVTRTDTTVTLTADSEYQLGMLKVGTTVYWFVTNETTGVTTNGTITGATTLPTNASALVPMMATLTAVVATRANSTCAVCVGVAPSYP